MSELAGVSGSGVRPGNRETAAAREVVDPMFAAYTNCAAEMRREARYQHEQARLVGGAEVHGYARDRALEMAGVFDLWAEAALAASLPVLPETREDEDDGFGPLHGVAAPLSGRRAPLPVETKDKT